MSTGFFSRLFRKTAIGGPLIETDEVTQLIEEHLGLAATFQVARKPLQALDACNQVLGLDPMNTTAYHIRAMAKYSLGDRVGAKRDWALSDMLKSVSVAVNSGE